MQKHLFEKSMCFFCRLEFRWFSRKSTSRQQRAPRDMPSCHGRVEIVVVKGSAHPPVRMNFPALSLENMGERPDVVRKLPREPAIFQIGL